MRGEVDLLDEARLRRGRGAEGGAGGGGGAGLTLLRGRLLHHHHGQAATLYFDGDVAGGITASVQRHQEVAVVLGGLLGGLLQLRAGGFPLLLFTSR